MITFDECGAMLDEIADSMPYELYRDLNGGISLLPQLKVHPKALNNDLFILGEYIRNSLGNAIVFYYGSINRVYGSLDNEEYRKSSLKYFITRFAIITSILQVAMTSEFLTEIRLTITLENTGNNQMKFKRTAFLNRKLSSFVILPL